MNFKIGDMVYMKDGELMVCTEEPSKEDLNQEGYETCERCKGEGFLYPHDNQEGIERHFCPICQGAGKLNWIEKVFGKEVPEGFSRVMWSAGGGGGGVAVGGLTGHNTLSGLQGGCGVGGYGAYTAASNIGDFSSHLSIGNISLADDGGELVISDGNGSVYKLQENSDYYHLSKEEYDCLQEIINEKKNKKKRNIIDKIRDCYERIIK